MIKAEHLVFDSLKVINSLLKCESNKIYAF